MKIAYTFLVLFNIAVFCLTEPIPKEVLNEPVFEMALPEVTITPYEVADSALLVYLGKHIKNREGFESMPYPDPGDGKLAVGYGTKITEAQAREIILKGGISRREGEELSWQHYKTSVSYCRYYFGDLPLKQETAVVSLMRAMGIGSLLKSDLAQYIHRRDFSPAAKVAWLRTGVRFANDRTRICKNNLPSRQLEANLWVANADMDAERYVWEVVNGKRTPSRYNIP